jgi:hypothetical protein
LGYTIGDDGGVGSEEIELDTGTSGVRVKSPPLRRLRSSRSSTRCLTGGFRRW